jgi:hypothetical protein
MHGTLPKLPAVARRPRAKTAILKAVVTALGAGVLAAAAIYEGYSFANATGLGHKLLIRWGLEYPPDCG